MRPELLRGLALLVGVLTVVFVYEHLQVRDYGRTTGEVVHVERATDSGIGGDHRRFTIRFTADGERYRFSTRRSVVEQVGRFSDLDVGGEVPVAYDPAAPSDGRLGTFYHTHTLTVTVGAFTGLYVLVVGWLVVSGRLR